VNKVKNLNVDYMKIPKTHCGKHKMPSGATCGPRVCDPGLHGCEITCALKQIFAFYLNFSYREHCWWLTSQTCVNTLINETSVKFEAITLYQFEILLFISRRATQNMLATHNSPTIGLNLRALPLSPFTVSLHNLPRRLHSIVTCGKTPTTVT